jgi:hypothetical protein
MKSFFWFYGLTVLFQFIKCHKTHNLVPNQLEWPNGSKHKKKQIQIPASWRGRRWSGVEREERERGEGGEEIFGGRGRLVESVFEIQKN